LSVENKEAITFVLVFLLFEISVYVQCTSLIGEEFWFWFYNTPLKSTLYLSLVKCFLINLFVFRSAHRSVFLDIAVLHSFFFCTMYDKRHCMGILSVITTSSKLYLSVDFSRLSLSLIN